jgi:hypothetical protein
MKRKLHVLIQFGVCDRHTINGKSTRVMIINPIGTLRIDVEPASAWDFGFGRSGSARS